MHLNFVNLSDLMQKTGGQMGTPGTACVHAALSRPHLTGSAGDTRGQTPDPMMDGQVKASDLSPMSPNRPQPWGHGKCSNHAIVPVVPNVPAKKQMNEIDRKSFKERAAILVLDGGRIRAEAERLAAESLEVST